MRIRNVVGRTLEGHGVGGLCVGAEFGDGVGERDGVGAMGVRVKIGDGIW